jgi:hypothetical protein
MTEELIGCPFCDSYPYFTGDGDNWRDDNRYVEMGLQCCVYMHDAIGWRQARDMTTKERADLLTQRLIERWNDRV